MHIHLTRLTTFLLLAAAGAPALQAQCPEQSFQGVDTTNQDRFGTTLSTSGSRMLVGAPRDDDQGNLSGSAYVFRSGPGGYVQEAKLTGVSVGAGDRFGISAAIWESGGLVGAPFGDGFGNNSGSLFAFKRAGLSWVQTQELHPGEGDAGDQFGWAVAIDGNRAVIGAPFAQSEPGEPTGGAAYIFERDGNDAWQFITKLVPNDINNEPQYGFSVAIDGDRIVVGAPRDNDGGFDSGAAYVFDKFGSNWILSIKLIPTDFEVDSLFGWAVSVDDDEVLVGSPLSTTTSGNRTGAAYVFGDSAGSWTQDVKLFDPAGAASDLWGFSVSIDLGQAVIGAPGTKDGGQTVGSAYKCSRNSGAWQVIFAVESPSASAAARNLGVAVHLQSGLFAASDPADGEDVVHTYELGGQDCNGNGILDACDIASGTSLDNNGNGIPDECDGCGWTPECTSSPNSTGSAALMSPTGSVSVSANDFLLHASPVPTQPGIFFYGASQNSTPFGNGTLCIGPPFQRLAVVSAQGNVLTFPLDNTSPPTPAGQITPFTTWYFQCWYRDPAGGGDFFDLSDSVKVTFCP